MRCGRSSTGSPLQLYVPGSRQIRAGLCTVTSILTSGVLHHLSSFFRSFSTNQPSSRGRSMRYINCAPFPESIYSGSAQSAPAKLLRISCAFASAAACSAPELEIPEGLTASQSISSQRRQRMSASVVVLWLRYSMPRRRLLDRAINALFTGFGV